jgi:hypothetical protein
MKSKKMIKFEELAERRMGEALNKIRLVGNLSHTGNYEYTEAHIKQIVSVLKAAVKDVETKFSNKGRSDKEGFKFKI